MKVWPQPMLHSALKYSSTGCKNDPGVDLGQWQTWAHFTAPSLKSTLFWMGEMWDNYDARIDEQSAGELK